MNEDKTATIRADIERTRGDMSRTVNEIEERLSPAHLKEQFADVKEAAIGQYHEAKDHVKQDLSRELSEAKLRVQEEVRQAKRTLETEVQHAKRAVHEATVGKVQHMARDARNGIMGTIRENPIPSAMIAIGIGWLFMGGGNRRDARVRVREYGHDFDRDYDRDFGRDYRRDFGEDRSFTRRVRRGASEALHSMQEGAAEKLHEVSDAAASLTHRAGDEIEHIAHDARDAARHFADDAQQTGRRVAEGAGRVVERAGRQAMRAERGIETTIRENPLAVGAVVLAVGAAVGLALPHTEREDALMGEAKDRLLERAQSTAHDALQSATTKVDEIARTAEKKTSQMMRESNPSIS